MSKIVIIGNGIAGVTCARHIRKKSTDEIIIISGETPHFFSRTALMYVYMGHMKFEHTKPYEDFFWQKSKIQLLQKWVTNINTETSELIFTDGTTLGFDKLVLATGSTTNKFGWPGQNLKGVQGLYSFQDLELMEANTKNCRNAVIIGGGLIGVEMAEMLHSRGIEVTFLVREKYFWSNVLPKEDAILIGNHITKNGIKLLFETELKEIIGDANGVVSKIITNTNETIECQFVGLTTGVKPNIDWLKNTPIQTDRGILVNEFFETNIPNIYAIGDCAQFITPPKGRRPIEQVWYTGRMHGETVAETIVGKPTKYNPGFWFNSAKFFNIEYQTYGVVLPTTGTNETTFFWQHATKEIALRLVFDSDSRKFIALNVYGIRLRHNCFDAWQQQEKSIEFVLENFTKANFDPEFYSQYHREIITAFNTQFNTNIATTKKKWFAIA